MWWCDFAELASNCIRSHNSWKITYLIHKKLHNFNTRSHYLTLYLEKFRIYCTRHFKMICVWKSLLKLINNSSSLNKGNHHRDGVWISDPNCASYFQLSSRCLDIPTKHCHSCLIYYLKTSYDLQFVNDWSSRRCFDVQELALVFNLNELPIGLMQQPLSLLWPIRIAGIYWQHTCMVH